MTDKEKACKACCNSIPCKKMCNYARCYMAALTAGRKEICEICEKKMIEGNPNIKGCAYRKLGNEYCWEKQNEGQRKGIENN